MLSELILIAHIRWTIEIDVGTSTVFEHIECSLYRVLLFVRVHPLRVTRPVIDHRRPWRHNTTTVASNRPNQTTIRVVIMTVVESQSSRRRTVRSEERRVGQEGRSGVGWAQSERWSGSRV